MKAGANQAKPIKALALAKLSFNRTAFFRILLFKLSLFTSAGGVEQALPLIGRKLSMRGLRWGVRRASGRMFTRSAVIVIVMIVMIIMTTSGVRIVGWGALCFLILQDPLIDLLEKMGIKPLAKGRKQRWVKRWLLLKIEGILGNTEGVGSL